MTDRHRLVTRRLENAREALAAAQALANDYHWSAYVNRLYYACFYAAGAVLVVRNLAPKTHSGVRKLLGQYFGEPGYWPESIWISTTDFSTPARKRITTTSSSWMNPSSPGSVRRNHLLPRALRLWRRTRVRTTRRQFGILLSGINKLFAGKRQISTPGGVHFRTVSVPSRSLAKT